MAMIPLYLALGLALFGLLSGLVAAIDRSGAAQ